MLVTMIKCMSVLITPISEKPVSCRPVSRFSMGLCSIMTLSDDVDRSLLTFTVDAADIFSQDTDAHQLDSAKKKDGGKQRGITGHIDTKQ